VALKTTRHTHPLCNYTPQIRTPSDFAGLHTHIQVYESTITRIMKGIENTRLHKPGSPMIRSCTSAKLNNNLANFEKLLSKLISISLV